MKILKISQGLIFALLFMPLFIMAQEVVETETTMSLGRQNSFMITIEGADKDMIEDEWKDYIKEYGKVKKNKKAKEQYIVDAKIPIIYGSAPIDVYSKIEERKDQATLYFWVDLKGGFIVSDEHPREAENVRGFLNDFWVIVKKKVIREELKEAEKELEKQEKELKKLEDKNKDLHEDIEEYNDKVRKAEMDIEENLRTQDDSKLGIEEQKKAVQEVVERLNNVGRE
jgi:predicted RNase H-like nuclease (RuvC/YqgF family)